MSGKRGDERKGEGQQGEEIKKHIHKIPYASLCVTPPISKSRLILVGDKKPTSLHTVKARKKKKNPTSHIW